MLTPSAEIIALLEAFRSAFTAPTFQNALLLLYGTILTPGPRTVSAALRVLGLASGQSFGKYHRVLNRAAWSPMLLSRLLLATLIRLFVPAGAPLILIVDETLERRKGPKIRWRGWARDAVRSTATQVAYSLGIRWVVMAILVPVPWSSRPWALPFLVVPAPSAKTSQKLGRRHHTVVEHTERILCRVRRWQPDRDITLVGDGTYACVHLVRCCQNQRPAIRLVTRLRLDALLHDDPLPQPPSKRGRKPRKGPRQRRLDERLSDPTTDWLSLTVSWYAGTEKTCQAQTGRALWCTPGQVPVPIRWLLVTCPGDPHSQPMALLCSDPNSEPAAIVAWFVTRWNIEITFEEIRAHLGFESQRHWSQRAIERCTPCLFGVFSLVVAMARLLHPETLPVRDDPWYTKPEPTFTDALAAVRAHLWLSLNYENSAPTPGLLQFPPPLARALFDTLCYAA
jgi:hypothetical protein